MKEQLEALGLELASDFGHYQIYTRHFGDGDLLTSAKVVVFIQGAQFTVFFYHGLNVVKQWTFGNIKLVEKIVDVFG